MKILKLGEIQVIAKKRTNNTPKEINQYIKEKKNDTIQKITEKLQIPKTQVEHYFRTDKSRAIPSPEIWTKLKNILNLDNRYDKNIMEFYNKEVKYEIGRRYYHPAGISPTLEASANSPLVLVSPKSTNTQSKFIKNISIIKNMEISQKSTHKNYLTSTSSVAGSHAKRFLSLEKDLALKTLEELSSMMSFGLSKKNTPSMCYLKMLKDCFLTTQEELLKPSSPRLQNWGILSNGKCLTQRISESPRIGKECSLSDILEDSVDDKYFLSEKAVKAILNTAGQSFQLDKNGCKMEKTLAETLAKDSESTIREELANA